MEIISDLELVTELQAKAIKALAARLAELGDTTTGRDEIAAADEAYQRVIGEETESAWTRSVGNSGV